MCKPTARFHTVVPDVTRWYIGPMQEEPSAPGEKSAAANPPVTDDGEDAAAVLALTRGDKGALAALYDRHGGLLLALGIRILSDRTLAEDVLHDCFLEAWHHAGDYDVSRGSVRAWLVTRMRSRCLDRRASVLRQRRLADEVKREGGGDVPGAAAPTGPALDNDRVRLQLAGLPPDLALVIELAYFDGLSSSEIASKLGIPIGTVKSRTARALGQLRAGLIGDEGPAEGREGGRGE
jgi:RNA polymerase sigma-70 factor, ECF subfamily